jgi:hypothetical protein
MARTIRFHLDENCARSIARGLLSHGIDVTLTAEAGLGEATDQEQIEFATVNGRVFVTQDSDFFQIHQSGFPHHGIVYSPKDRRTVGEIIRGLILIWEVYDAAEMIGKLEVISKEPA